MAAVSYLRRCLTLFGNKVGCISVWVLPKASTRPPKHRSGHCLPCFHSVTTTARSAAGGHLPRLVGPPAPLLLTAGKPVGAGEPELQPRVPNEVKQLCKVEY